MEINVKICKVCNLPKTRIESGFYPGKGKIKIYTDELQNKWNGLTCPECNKNRMKKVMQANRLGKV